MHHTTLTPFLHVRISSKINAFGNTVQHFGVVAKSELLRYVFFGSVDEMIDTTTNSYKQL